MKNNKLKNKNQEIQPCSRSGQLLIEMLVALGILTFGFLGVTTLLSRALALNRVVSDNYTATYLASEGIEITKNILDSNVIKGSPDGLIAWNEGFSNGDFEADFKSLSLARIVTGVRNITYDTLSNQYGYDPVNGTTVETPFQRTITVDMPNVNEVVVHSRVDWTSRGEANFNVDLEDHFFNWR